MAGRTPAIEARGVVKVLGGRRVLDDVSLTAECGQVIGLIGPNGAGKSTLIRILSGLARATDGEVRRLGAPPDRNERDPAILGLLPEAPGFVEHMSGRRNLRLLASIRGRVGPEEVDEAIRECGLDPADRRPVRKYSLGMRQRLGLAQALMEQPDALILDEPTNGLDVLGITELRRIVRRRAENGVAVLLASHLLTEVELACDRVLMIKEGRILRSLDVRELQRLVGLVRVSVSSEADWRRLAARFDARPSGGQADGHRSGLVATELPVPAVVRELVAIGVSVEEIGPATATLEEMFLATIGAEP